MASVTGKSWGQLEVAANATVTSLVLTAPFVSLLSEHTSPSYVSSEVCGYLCINVDSILVF